MLTVFSAEEIRSSVLLVKNLMSLGSDFTGVCRGKEDIFAVNELSHQITLVRVKFSDRTLAKHSRNEAQASL